MNEHYEKVFDAIENVDHNRKDKTIIEVGEQADTKLACHTPPLTDTSLHEKR